MKRVWVALLVLLLVSVGSASGQITRTSLPVDMLNIPVDANNVPYPITARSGAGSTCTAATLTTAITALGATRAVLPLPPNDGAGASCTWTLEASVTTNANTRLLIAAPVSVNSGFTLTLNGPHLSLIGPNWWSGDGTVTFNYREAANAENYTTMFAPFVASGGNHATSGSMTSAAFATTYVTRAGYRTQASVAINYSAAPVSCAATDTAWVIAHDPTSTASLGSFQRSGATDYYVDCTSATRPALPANSAFLMRVAIVTSQLSTVNDIRTLDPGWDAKARQTFSGTKYGMACDGSTDDTTALQNAIDAASEYGDSAGADGGVVLIPQGICRVGALTWRSDVTLRGAGIRMSILECNSAAATMLTYAPGALANQGGSLEDLWFDGNGSAQCAIGLSLTDASRMSFRRVWVSDFSTTGVLTRGSLVLRIYDSVIENSVIGLDMQDNASQDANLIMIRDTVISSHTTAGLRYDNGAMLVLDGVDMEGNGTSGDATTETVRVSNLCESGTGIGLIVKDSWFEGNNGHSVIRIQNAAAAPCWHIVRHTQIFGGTRTYGIQVASGANISYLFDNVVALNAGTSDIDDDGGFARGYILHSQTSTSSVSATLATRQPDPSSLDDVVWNYGGNITFNMGSSDIFFLDGTGVRFGLRSSPDANTDMQIGEIDGTATTDNTVVRLGAIDHLTAASRGAGLGLVVPNVAAGAANDISINATVRNDANTGEGAYGVIRLHKSAGADLGQWEIRPSTGGGTHVDGLVVNPTTTADDVRMTVYDVTGATGKQVSRGAVDSGGSGFRVLRIAN